MSSPRYDWWGYVKAIIRRYPRMKDADVSGNVFLYLDISPLDAIEDVAVKIYL